MKSKISTDVLLQVLIIIIIIAFSILIFSVILRTIEDAFNPGNQISNVFETFSRFSGNESKSYIIYIAIIANIFSEILVILALVSKEIAHMFLDLIIGIIRTFNPNIDIKPKKVIGNLSIQSTILIALFLGILCIVCIIKVG